MVFRLSMSGRKSPQVSRTLLSILADLNNAVVWMDSTCSLISIASSPCTSPLVTVPSTPITTGISVTFMFHSFFSVLWQGLGIYLSFAFYPFYPVAKSIIREVHFFLLTISRFSLLTEIRWSVCISYYYNYYHCFLRVFFYTNVSWWWFTVVWVAASLQDSAQYLGLSLPYCNLDDIGSSFDFKLFYLFNQAFGYRFKFISYSQYHRHLHVS